MKTNSALDALGALAQESRLAVFRLLVEQGSEGLAAGAIGEATGLAPATLSFHLKELARAELVMPRQDGRFIYYRANYDHMTALIGYLTENCCRASGCAPRCATTSPTKRPRAASSRRNHA
ncbi:MAG: metalloregulator ArsR/SmtB family transcription factor [Casimicrobiaceae bacterium]